MLKQPFQTVNQNPRKLERSWHVWYRQNPNRWKCVLCGGITDTPTNNEICAEYERLNDAERDMFPYLDKN